MPVFDRMRRTTGYASGCTDDESSGSSPSGIRRKPAHCSNAFGPSRATSFSAVRERNGPFVSRCETMFSASPVVMPETRVSSGADAVLTSTPTAFTQSSTTASSERDSDTSDRSCWYCPTPIDFGSIFTSSASGSCSRRAIETAPRSETSMSGQLGRSERRRRVHRRARLGHDGLRQLQLRVLLDQLLRELVRLARRRAVADRDQVDLVPRRTAPPARRSTGPTCSRAGAGR